MAELLALSPSRAIDFMQCPLKFRFVTVDRIPTGPSPAAYRGTLVHDVLERLFDSPAQERTWDTAVAQIPVSHRRLLAQQPEIAELYPAEADERTLWNEAAALLRSYFGMELPDRLEPAAREQYLTVTLDNGLQLRGFIDRVDVAPGGQVRIVDYKTGKQPRPQYSRDADFQMRFYALLKHRHDGVLVHTLQLMYLGSRSIKSYRPSLDDIARTEEQILQLWDEITDCAVQDTWRPRTSKLCDWCDFRSMCPAWGNEAPQPPEITEIAGRSASA